MSQDNLIEMTKLYMEVPKRLPPLRSNSTRPQQRGLAISINKLDKDQKREPIGKELNNNQGVKQIIQKINNCNQDLGVVLEQQKLQNKLNDQELQAIANRIQFIQNQQMNVWKKTNDLYQNAVHMYENKKRCQIDRTIVILQYFYHSLIRFRQTIVTLLIHYLYLFLIIFVQMHIADLKKEWFINCLLNQKQKEKLKDKKEMEIGILANKNEQLKDQIRQKLSMNNEQMLSSKKKQAQDIKDKSRELNHLRDYFRSTFQKGNKQKYDEVKQGIEKAQVKIQNFYEEKTKQYKEHYCQRILEEQMIKEQKGQQIKELEEVERCLLDQFKKTKLQQQQLLHQVDEAHSLEAEQIEQRYPVFASLAQNNLLQNNQFDISISIHEQRNSQMQYSHHHNPSSSSSSISPFKKQMIRNRQHSQNKVVASISVLQQDQMQYNTYTKSKSTHQQHINQYSSIQAKKFKNNAIEDENKDNSSQNTIQNTRYGNIYRSVTSKKQYVKPNLNYSAIYENQSIANNTQQETPSLKLHTHHQFLEQQEQQEQQNEQYEQKQEQQILQYNDHDHNDEDKVRLEKQDNYDDAFNVSSSPEKNNSTKVSLSNKAIHNKSIHKDKSASKTSQGKIDLSMYQPQNLRDNKKVSLENNSSSFLIATEGDIITSHYKRNKFNHFGDIMLNRDDISKQRKLLLSQQKQGRSKSFVTPNKAEITSPYQNNNYCKF